MNNDLLLTRQKKLLDGIEAAEFDAVLFNPGPSFRYFTGLDFHLSERPVVAWFKPGSPVGFVVPEFEATKLNSLGYEAVIAAYDERPDTWGSAFARMVADLNLEKSLLAAEPLSMRLLEIDFIRSAAPGSRMLSDEDLVAGLRVRKDSSEIELMKKAASVAEAAMRETLPEVRIGMTEKQVAGLLTSNILMAGSDPKLPFAPIVGFGPNSALPHHFPTDRPLAAGAQASGYASDMTRVFSVDTPDVRYQEIAAVVSRANRAAQALARPGAKAMALDQAAREVIVDAGYGNYFTHRTGHGLGLDGHEPPYIRSDNDRSLEIGMAFTIEPGIYLPGDFGVRIEDNVVITAEGSAVLTTLSHEVLPLEQFRA